MKRLPRETDDSTSKLLLQKMLQGHAAATAACFTGLLAAVAMVSAYVNGAYNSFILCDKSLNYYREQRHSAFLCSFEL